MNQSLSETTEFVKAKTPGLISATIFMKKTCKFTETVRLFVCFLPVFSSFRIRSCFYIFQHFNFCQPSFKNKQLH
jgi:hypothetical protein